MNPPDQAVILCGGRGRRLAPFTDHTPKPMIPVNGRPFLQYLLEQLRACGVGHVALCTGYLASQISDCFGDGSRLGLRLTYSEQPPEWESGARLREVRELVFDRFLLLYADNFVPFDIGRMQRFRDTTSSVVTLLLAAKARGNVRVQDGKVLIYDPQRAAPGLDHVEIGYMMTDRRIFEAVPPGNSSLSAALRALADAGEVTGVLCEDRYHSVSDPERWRLAERYLADKKILLLDRDGVINERPPRGEYVSSWDGFRFIERNVLGLEALAAEGYTFVVISNQAGIGRGLLGRDTVDAINGRMVAALAARGIEVHDVYLCPHHWEDHCACRKPAPGLLLQASWQHLIRLDRTLFIGDDPRDCQAAERAGCPSVYLGAPDELAHLAPWERPALVAPDLLAAVDWIKGRP